VMGENPVVAMLRLRAFVPTKKISFLTDVPDLSGNPVGVIGGQEGDGAGL